MNALKCQFECIQIRVYMHTNERLNAYKFKWVCIRYFPLFIIGIARDGLLAASCHQSPLKESTQSNLVFKVYACPL